MQEEVEQVFMEKQRKENQLRQLREQMDKVILIKLRLISFLMITIFWLTVEQLGWLKFALFLLKAQ